jgi:asparagine synthase (glutamine-hydrolysing)
MGSISGIFKLNNQPVNEKILKTMLEVSTPRGPDREGLWFKDNIGLASRILFTTNESTLENQPAFSLDQKYIIVFDGIIYNRDELIYELSRKNIIKDLFTDSELIVNLFSVIKLDVLNKLIGDYSYVIWDISDKKLICVRDHIGAVPFHYCYEKNKHFIFASQINQLLCTNEVDEIPNETFIGETLLNSSSSDEETLFKNIFRLPPAHCLIVYENKIKRFKYWDIDPTYEIKYRDDNEYTDHFFELFSKSVKNCLRSNYPVGSMASGGLDSSSVTSIANDLIKINHKNVSDLTIFSLIFPDLDCDESNYISDLSDYINRPFIKVEPKIEDYGWCEEDVDLHLVLPFFPNLNMCKPIYNRAKAHGIKVMLTGQGGDEWTRGCYFYLSDLMISRKFDYLYKELSSLYKIYGMGDLTIILFRYLLKPSIPSKIRKSLRAIINKILRNAGNPLVPEWINEEFATRIKLKERLNSIINIERFRAHSQNYNYNVLHDFTKIINQEDMERFSSSYSIQDRHPFNNKDLMEFCFSLPENQKISSFVTKSILRKSIKNHLPHSIQTRKTKAFFSQLLLNTLTNKNFCNAIGNLKIANIGWINKNKLFNEYKKMLPYFKTNNPICYKFMWQLSLVYSLDMWYKKIYNN